MIEDTGWETVSYLFMVKLLKGVCRGRFKGELKWGVWYEGDYVWVLEEKIGKSWHKGGKSYCNSTQTSFRRLGESSSIIYSMLKRKPYKIYSLSGPKFIGCGWDEGRGREEEIHELNGLIIQGISGCITLGCKVPEYGNSGSMKSGSNVSGVLVSTI